MAQQAAFDASRMNPDAEAILNQLHQIRQSNGWFFLALLPNEREDLVGELVRLLWAALVRHQAGQSGLLEGG